MLEKENNNDNNNNNKTKTKGVVSKCHLDNMNKISNIISNNQYDKLLEYNQFDLEYFDDVERLIKKLRKNDKVLLHIINNTLDLEFVCVDKKKLVHYICEHASYNVIKFILDKKIDLESEDESKNRPIHIICDRSSMETIKYLMDKGVNLMCANSCGKIPLNNIYNSYTETDQNYLFKYAIEKIINNKNLSAEKLTGELFKLIQFMAKYSTFEMCKYVINQGVNLGINLEYIDEDGLKLIHYTCKNNMHDLVAYLIEKGVDLESEDKAGWKPIHYACRFSKLKIINCLINKGVNLECQTATKNKPIHFACKYGSSETVMCLLDEKVDILSRNDENNRPFSLMSNDKKGVIYEYILKMKGIEF